MMARAAARNVLDPHRGSAAIAAFSLEVSRIHERYFGNMPGEVEVAWGEGFLVCTLRGALTDAEWRLVDHGLFDRVRADRQAMHDALRPTYAALVESLTGRAVRAYMSEVDEKGIAFEAFVLDG